MESEDLPRLLDPGRFLGQARACFAPCGRNPLLLWACDQSLGCRPSQKRERADCVRTIQLHQNPLYLGNFVIGISVATASCSWWILSLFIVYFLLFYPLVIKKEEEKMSSLFPEEFEEYREKVPLFFPSFKKASLARKSKFSSKLYRKNREWRASVGALFFWLILAAKMMIS
jgi:hypothetical protein